MTYPTLEHKRFPKEPHSTLRQKPGRGSYDTEIIYPIIDEAMLLHLGFSAEDRTFVIPMAFARRGDAIYIHGAKHSRVAALCERGASFCMCFTHLDGLILAKSALHHSMNYRSVVAFGSAELVTDDQEKEAALELFLEKLIPGRAEDTRLPTKEERDITFVGKITISTASAKSRSGGPKEAKQDTSLPFWSGTIPIERQIGEPIPDPEYGVPRQPHYLQTFVEEQRSKT